LFLFLFNIFHFLYKINPQKSLTFPHHRLKFNFFPLGNFEKCVSLMVERNKDESKENIIENIFSHDRVLEKNALVIKIIVSY